MAIMVLVVGSACHGRGRGGRRGRACGDVMATIKDVGRVDSDCCHYNRGRDASGDEEGQKQQGREREREMLVWVVLSPRWPLPFYIYPTFFDASPF